MLEINRSSVKNATLARPAINLSFIVMFIIGMTRDNCLNLLIM